MRTNMVAVAVVGGGASGALIAAHLLREASPPGYIVVVERDGRVGEGIAYSTGSKCHLLNVPARSMSAFEDDPEHFVRWLDTRGLPAAADSFVPRKLYGRYLREVLWSLGRHRAPLAALSTVHASVTDLELGPQGPQLVLDNGQTIATKAVVLATGVVMQQFPPSLAATTRYPRCVVDPWAQGALVGVDPSATVTLLGSGLTAVDVLLSLRESGHRGPVHAISRHGLLPRAHRAQPQDHQALEVLCRDLEGSQARLLLHRAREILEGTGAGGADWRDVVDALRPEVPRLWAGLSNAEQLRFRRHLERLWSINRHRMAPQVAQTVEELRDAGIFFVHAGEVGTVSKEGSSLRLEVKLPVRTRPYAWRTDWLVNCTGTDPHLFQRGGPLMDALMARGFA
ncbi:MAG TPA: FAD/NAD(P)-binding protein, partial [Acidimicrobiales bacterium]|nr:FAD/NAD(P)-binding protein [Acidimicrobiales bacterium]